MRAARVVEMLLLLQRRGRITAAELGETLEVSERTVLRDVEALSEAGIPVFTSQGSGGGIELLADFRTNVTVLDADEAAAVFLSGSPLVARRLGLAAASRRARAKLLESLRPAAATTAESLDSWFLHDPDPWRGHTIPHGELRRLGDAIRRRRWVDLRFRGESDQTVAPLAIVLKAGEWHVVDASTGQPTLCSLGDLVALRITRRVVEVPAGWELISWWNDLLQD